MLRHGAMDQDWRSKTCALKCASQPPDWHALALLSLPSQSGKGAPQPYVLNLCSRHLLDLVMIIQLVGGYTTAEGWLGISSRT